MLDALTATSVRAAALSATFILINKAALVLDIDPEEFDVIEPRMFRPAGRAWQRRSYRSADHLVNGAGFCNALGTPDPVTGRTLIASLLRDVVTDESDYPIREFTRDNHEHACEQECYRCLLRYRNQPFHGLLDWRLGLAFLKHWPVRTSDADWTEGSMGLRVDVANACGARHPTFKAPVQRGQIRNTASLWAVRFERGTRWGLVAHPLWDPEALDGALGEAVAVLGDEPFTVVDLLIWHVGR